MIFNDKAITQLIICLNILLELSIISLFWLSLNIVLLKKWLYYFKQSEKLIF